MIEGLLGRKLGMTQVFDEGGVVTPVTVIQAGPCVVVQKKTEERDGYSALQLGLVEPRKARATKPMEGHFQKAGVPPTRILKEFGFGEEEDKPVQVGDQVLVQDVFQVDDLVSVSGKSIGKGFQGVIKRHNFGGGKATHGSMFHRAPGSIGSSASPSRVFAGMKGPGQMGSRKVKIRKLRVMGVDAEKNILLVKGAVPGSRGSELVITRS